MPDTPQPPADQAADAPDVEEAIYDGGETSYDQELAAAFQPTDEDYGPFDPREAASGQPEVATEDEDRPEQVIEFDPRYREDFEGLLFIGSLRKSFHWMGHRFVIRTLGTNEIIEVGLVQKPYVGSMGEIKAYQAASVAAAIVSVDGKPPPIPITDEDSILEARFQYVINHWSPIVIDMLYGQLLELENRVNEVLIAMGKAQG